MKTITINADGMSDGANIPSESLLMQILESTLDSLIKQGFDVEDILEDYRTVEAEGWTEQSDYSFDDVQSAVNDALAEEYPQDNGNSGYPNGGSRYNIRKLWMDKAVVQKGYRCREDDPQYLRCDFTLSKDPDTGELEATITDTTPVSMIFVASDSVPPAALLASAKPEDMPLTEDIESQDLIESFDAPLLEAIVEEHGSHTVIRNVVVLGETSVNGRSYPPETQLAATKFFEGAKAYCNHPHKGSTDSRDVRDIIGKHKNIRVVGNKTYSDLHLINNATVKDVILPAIKFDPALIGNSIAAKGKLNAQTGVVEAITGVRSIDLVCEPATTKGLLESAIQEDIDGNKKVKEDKGMEVKEAKDLAKDPALYESVKQIVLEEFKKEAEYKALQESVEREKKRGDDAEAKLLKLDMEKKETEKRAEIDRIVTESKIPDESKTDKLRATLYSRTVDDAKEFIASLEESVEQVRKQYPAKPTVVPVKKVRNTEKSMSSNRIGKDESLTESQYTSAFAALTKS